MGGGSDLQRLSGGENCVLGPRRGVPSHVIAETFVNLHAIEQTQLLRHHRVDGVE